LPDHDDLGGFHGEVGAGRVVLDGLPDGLESGVISTVPGIGTAVNGTNTVVHTDICHPQSSNTSGDNPKGVTSGARLVPFPVIRQS